MSRGERIDDYAISVRAKLAAMTTEELDTECFMAYRVARDVRTSIGGDHGAFTAADQYLGLVEIEYFKRVCT